MRDHVTFREILAKTADTSSRRLVERARVASSVAKVARDLASRRRAYAVKHAALDRGLVRFSQSFELSGLEEDGRLLRVKHKEMGCLHLPVSACTSEAQRWIAEERARVVQLWGQQAA